jgi:hypothetical protein
MLLYILFEGLHDRFQFLGVWTLDVVGDSTFLCLIVITGDRVYSKVRV